MPADDVRDRDRRRHHEPEGRAGRRRRVDRRRVATTARDRTGSGHRRAGRGGHVGPARRRGGRGHGRASRRGTRRRRARGVQPVLVDRARRCRRSTRRADAHVAGPARHRPLVRDHGPPRGRVHDLRRAARHPADRQRAVARAHPLHPARPPRRARRDRRLPRSDGLRDRAAHRPDRGVAAHVVHGAVLRQPVARCDLVRRRADCAGRGRPDTAARSRPRRRRDRPAPARRRGRARPAAVRPRVRARQRHCGRSGGRGRAAPGPRRPRDRHDQRARRRRRRLPHRPRAPDPVDAGTRGRPLRGHGGERPRRQGRRARARAIRLRARRAGRPPGRDVVRAARRRARRNRAGRRAA